jgi:hypothetical protein
MVYELAQSIRGHECSAPHATAPQVATAATADSAIVLPGATSAEGIARGKGATRRGHRIWAVQNFSNQVTRLKLSNDLSSGTPEKVITSGLFEIPTAAALFGRTLAVVNAKFDTGVPPTASTYEVVLTSA